MFDSQKKKPYPTSRPDSILIRLTAERDSEMFEMVHTFRPPSAEDKKTYQRLRSRIEFREGARAVIDDRGAAAEAVWHSCILRVDGYDCVQDPAWKDLVPLEHKQAAVEFLLASEGDLTEVERGN